MRGHRAILAIAAATGGCGGERAAPSAVQAAPANRPAATVDAADAESPAPVASAVRTGDPAQVRQLFAVEALDATDAATGARVPVLLAESVLSAPSEGLYVVLDTAGRLGDAHVQASRTRGWNKSASTPPLHVELQWVSPPARDARRSLHVVAVGPLEDTLPRARLLGVGIARAGLPAGGPDESDHVHGPHGPADLAVDLDGDGEADVASYQERHTRPGAAPHTLGWDMRGETWLRVPTSSPWRRVELCEWIDGTLVGP